MYIYFITYFLLCHSIISKKKTTYIKKETERAIRVLLVRQQITSLKLRIEIFIYILSLELNIDPISDVSLLDCVYARERERVREVYSLEIESYLETRVIANRPQE